MRVDVISGVGVKVDISVNFIWWKCGWKWEMFKNGSFLTFWHFLRLDFWVLQFYATEICQECQKWSKMVIFDDFGSKSLKSDNFDFFRNWGFIEKNEGGHFRPGGYSKLTWYCHSKSPASPSDRPRIVLFSLYFLFCKFYNKCGYTTGSFWKFWKRD